MPKKIRHWMGLVWKKCPVSTVAVFSKIGDYGVLNDIGSGLSSMAVCFDFHSSN